MIADGYPVAALALFVLALKTLSQQKALAKLFHWLPIPLWCYLVPMTAVTLGWLPAASPYYKIASDFLLPLALGLLLIGVDLASVLRTGKPALLSTAVGALAVMAGAIIGVRLLQPWLPEEAWKGAGALSATWTGGTMNLLAIRAMLLPPEAVFSPLILVDALVAYSWMALLIGLSPHQQALNRWLLGSRKDAIATTHSLASDGISDAKPRDDKFHQESCGDGLPAPKRLLWSKPAAAFTLSLGIALACRLLARALPSTEIMRSAMAWTVLLVTTVSLSLASVPSLRKLGRHGEKIGTSLLYLILALAGAQASLSALSSAPAWLGVGAIVLLLHGGALLTIGKMRGIPLNILATSSQANIGGFVSAPMVGAIYHPSLAPVGLLLAIGCNAVGTYLGLITATLCRI